MGSAQQSPEGEPCAGIVRRAEDLALAGTGAKVPAQYLPGRVSSGCAAATAWRREKPSAIAE